LVRVPGVHLDDEVERHLTYLANLMTALYPNGLAETAIISSELSTATIILAASLIF